MKPGRFSPMLLAAIALHAVLAGLYLVNTPVFEAPDEYLHYDYAFKLAHAGALPVMDGTAKGLGRLPSDQNGLAHHPPLFYGLLAATLELAGRPDVTPSILYNDDFASPDADLPSRHLRYRHGFDEQPPRSPEVRLLFGLRGWSLLCGLVSILLVHRLGRLVFPGRPHVADGAALLLACLPMWSFMHGVLDNGNLATVFSHAVFVVLAVAVVDERFDARRGLLLGLLVGAGLMTKLTDLALLPLVGGVYLWAWWRAGERRGTVLLSALVGGTVVVALSGWFFLRNQTLYGDPFALAVHEAAFAVNKVPDGQALDWMLHGFLTRVFSSMLGRFGYWIVPTPDWLILVGWVTVSLANIGIVGAGLLGFIKTSAPPAPTPPPDSPPTVQPRALLVAVAGAALVFLLVARFNTVFRQPQARYLFPGIGPMVLVLVFGLDQFVRMLPRSAAAVLRVVGRHAPLVIAVVVYLTVFRPALRPELAPAPAPHAVHHATLAGGLTTPRAARPYTLLAPADGARLTAPPELRWTRDPPPPPGRPPLVTLHMFTADGRVLVTSYEWFHHDLRGDRLPLPPRFWDRLPVDTEVLWTIQEVADRSAGQAPEDMPGSDVFRFTRLAEE